MRSRQLWFVGLIVLLHAGCDSPPPAPAPSASVSTLAAPPSTAPSPMGREIVPSPVETPLPVATNAPEAPPEVIAAQHILVAYRGAKGAPASVKRTKADAKKRAEEALQKARGGEDFSALVKVYSDEPGAADRLGSLGKFKHETKVKPFADAAFALKVGAVSDVVETEFGFHVIKRNQ